MCCQNPDFSYATQSESGGGGPDGVHDHPKIWPKCRLWFSSSNSCMRGEIQLTKSFSQASILQYKVSRTTVVWHKQTFGWEKVNVAYSPLLSARFIINAAVHVPSQLPPWHHRTRNPRIDSWSLKITFSFVSLLKNNEFYKNYSKDFHV